MLTGTSLAAPAALVMKRVFHSRHTVARQTENDCQIVLSFRVVDRPAVNDMEFCSGSASLHCGGGTWAQALALGYGSFRFRGCSTSRSHHVEASS